VLSAILAVIGTDLGPGQIRRREEGKRMYTKIMVPVDLTHVPQLDKALAAAADLSKHYSVPICYVSVTAATPGAIAHNPTEFAAKLDEFAKDQARLRGVENPTSKVYTSHDPSIDLDRQLIKAIEETGSDLVVMASHIPGFPEYLFASNAGYLAVHSKVSVLVIR
jgi:nucleotide-binding universal stress UspA family protein